MLRADAIVQLTFVFGAVTVTAISTSMEGTWLIYPFFQNPTEPTRTHAPSVSIAAIRRIDVPVGAVATRTAESHREAR